MRNRITEGLLPNVSNKTASDLSVLIGRRKEQKQEDLRLILYHGSKKIVESPEIRISKYNKDFYFGFYCTLLPEQAIRWAVRFNGTGYLNEYLYTPDSCLEVKQFAEMSEEWLDFIVSCRLGRSHEYDIVEGPMVNDTIFNYVQNFADGKIGRTAF